MASEAPNIHVAGSHPYYPRAGWTVYVTMHPHDGRPPHAVLQFAEPLGRVRMGSAEVLALAAALTEADRLILKYNKRI